MVYLEAFVLFENDIFLYIFHEIETKACLLCPYLFFMSLKMFLYLFWNYMYCPKTHYIFFNLAESHNRQLEHKLALFLKLLQLSFYMFQFLCHWKCVFLFPFVYYELFKKLLIFSLFWQYHIGHNLNIRQWYF